MTNHKSVNYLFVMMRKKIIPTKLRIRQYRQNMAMPLFYLTRKYEAYNIWTVKFWLTIGNALIKHCKF